MSDAGIPIGRRDVMIGAMACCLAPGLALADESDLPQKGDKLVLDAGPDDGKPVTLDGVTDTNGVVLAVPTDASGAKKTGSRFSKVLLIRLKPEEIQDEFKQHAVDGVVAFSAICTHAACTINAFNPTSRHLECFCHHSEFSPADGGAVAHGPAHKRLPMLPIAKGDAGALVVAGGFTGKPGIGPA
jgi:rieske iron-sulfur protein